MKIHTLKRITTLGINTQDLIDYLKKAEVIIDADAELEIMHVEGGIIDCRITEHFVRSNNFIKGTISLESFLKKALTDYEYEQFGRLDKSKFNEIEDIEHDTGLLTVLHGLFDWADTPQGDTYWGIVAHKEYSKEQRAEIFGDRDLFKHYEELPQNVIDILDKFEKLEGAMGGYEICRKMEEELEPLGYEFDWELEGQPFNLRKK
jgi:hypothetical protein